MTPAQRAAARDGAGASDTALQGDDRGDERFNLSAWALRHQALVVFLITLATLAGVLAYTRLGQSEDPPFTFRVMVIRTLWPGATARQVQDEITDRVASCRKRRTSISCAVTRDPASR
jgi:multidrug efflux pump